MILIWKQVSCVIFLLFTLCAASQAQPSSPPPYFGTNPSLSEIRAKLIHYGFVYKIPPHILFAIAQTEASGWKQYRDGNEDGQGHGRTTYHLEPNGSVGVGIMQITVFPSDPDYYNLCTDIDHNIEVGVQILAAKWAATPDVGDGHYEKGREKLENWYYAVWAYNSWGYINNPNNKNTPPPYTAKATVYQDTVYDYVRHCPGILAGMWADVDIKAPSNAEIGSITTGGVVGCGQKIANTPSPYHVDANFDGIIDGTEGGGGSDTDIWVDGGYSGAQNGTQANPYSTVKAAVDRASATQAVTIHIKPGTYSEKISTSRHIHFVTSGSGTVHIGG